MGLGHVHCVLDSWARLALHVETLRKHSKQEFTEKNTSLKWLFKTNVLSWDFLRAIYQNKVPVDEWRSASLAK